MAALFVAALFFFYLFSQGSFSPGKIAGNTRYPDMALRAEQAVRMRFPTRDMVYINRLVGQEEGNLLLWAFYDA